MTESDGGSVVPTDRFGVRLAIVRAEMGWNYDQAQTATGINSESWRLWERGRHCTDVIGASRRIAQVTPYSESWLVFGGPLMQEQPQRPRRARRTGAKMDAIGAGNSAASPGNTHQYMSSQREYQFSRNVTVEQTHSRAA